MDLCPRVVALIPHALSDDRTRQIFLCSLAHLSVVSRALGEMKKSTRKVLNYSIAVIVSFCCICLIFAMLANFSGAALSTPTPIQVFDTPLPIPTIIALTYSAARTQTAIVNPAPLFIVTLVPAIENIPTATTFISVLQTNNAAQPTEYIYSTNTPFSLATQPLQTIQSTLPPQTEVCSCSIDYNCPDFSSHSEAQDCFDYCKSLGYDDPSGLDRDNDNLACEDTNY